RVGEWEMADTATRNNEKAASTPAVPVSWLIKGPVLFLGACFLLWLLSIFPLVRLLVVRGAGALGPWTAPFVLRFDQDESREVQAAVADVVRQAGPAALPALLARLDDPNPRSRQFAANLLGNLGLCPETVPALAEMAQTDSDGYARLVAFRSLVNAGRNDERAVPALLQSPAPDAFEICLAAAEALAQFGPKASPATRALARALKASCPRTRQAAAEALEQIGPAAKEAIPALT